jgi:hypothetical protein
MNKDQIKERIRQIINETDGFITADQIYEQLLRAVDPGRTQDTIRKHIRELVNDQNYLIGSSNRGYYSINTTLKAEEAIHYLISRIPDLQTRADNIRRIWNENHPDDQI